MNNTAGQDCIRFSDEELMELYQNGLEVAFNEIVRRYQSRLFGLMIIQTQNRQDCEDLVQDTFLCVSRSKHSYSRQYKFSPWIFTIARNLLITHYRRHRHLAMIHLNQEPADSRNLPDVRLHRLNLMTGIRRAIGELPPNNAELLQLRLMDGLSYREISEKTGLPAGTVKSRIGRGRVRLRERLKMFIEEL